MEETKHAIHEGVKFEYSGGVNSLVVLELLT